jgi:cohesin loading factor subunit SCC2
VSRIHDLSALIGATQALTSLVDTILNVVLVASDSTVVQLRTKALKALSSIVTSDPEVLRDVRAFLSSLTLPFTCIQPKVRRSIEGHLLDNSPAVRDATVELLGKYIIQSPQLASDYYEKIADRIAVGDECFSVVLVQ